jgi:Peptidase family S41
MVFEDGNDQTLAALQLLASQKDELICPDLKILPLTEFLEQAQSVRLTRRQKEILVDQATLLIDEFYAHLPFKRARYAEDPVQRFRLIHAQLHHYPTDLAFHDQMIQAFQRLRDAHTFYGLPAPYRGSFAFLPFRMNCFGEPGRRRFLVTNVLDGFEHPRFGVGAEITYWQGMPLERAIEREADHEPGCNPASRFVRGMRRMTKRDLAFSLPPDEYSVVVQYIPRKGGAEQFSIALRWSVATACLPDRKQSSFRSSVHESMAALNQLSQILWRRKQFVIERKMAQRHLSVGAALNAAPAAEQAPDDPADLRHVSKFPHVFEFQYADGAARADFVDPANLRDPANPDKKFAYVKIKTFELDPAHESSDAFVDEFQRIVELMQQEAQHGLIVDVRSNPGGAIDAAERILQLMTPRRIEPARFHFINSQQTQKIAFRLKDEEARSSLNADQLEWNPWVTDLLASVHSADFVTAGRTLTPTDAANDREQCYQGPVTLLIDASSYSATDIFAAGFQDHGIGQVIGVDENTGGGGANRWLHEQLRENLKTVAPSVEVRKLPGDAQMGLAIRRSSRVGRNAGTFLEDEGVKRDVAYTITRSDILNHDRDLLRFACGQLGAQPTRSLKILKAELWKQDGIVLCVETHNIYRIDCFVDDKPQCAFAVVDGENNFWVPTGGLVDLPPSQVRVESYAKFTDQAGVEDLQLVSKAILNIETEPAAPEAPAVSANTGP